MQVAGNEHYGDEIRLKNRFLDLRREKVKNNIILRSKVISFIRSIMIKWFPRVSNPILTAASPEGARDFSFLREYTVENLHFLKHLNNLSS